MTKEKLIEIFTECWEECELSTKVQIHNEYILETENMDDEIFENDEDFFNTFFEGKPFEAVRSCFFGHYEYSDTYVWFNGYANLDTGDYEDQLPLRDADELAEYYIENYANIEHLTEFAEFVEACENGDDEDEDEE